MNLIYREVIELKEKLQDVGKRLKENDVRAIKDASTLANDIKFAYTTLIGDVPELLSMGVELPVDVLVAQLNRYIEGCEYCDIMLLTDNINYEIMDTISVYEEILEQLI